MALPTTNITTALVRNTIGGSTNKVAHLCTDPQVNKWSRWKPIRASKITGITISDLQAVNYGLHVNSSTSLSLLKALLPAEGEVGGGVTYSIPMGGSSSPFRLGDFRNYNHSATIPWGTGVSSSTPITVKKGSAAIYNQDYILNPVYGTFTIVLGSTYQIGYDELYPNIADLYAALYLRNKTNNEEVWFTSNWNYTEGGGTILPSINWNVAPIKTWTGEIEIYYFMTNFKRLQGAAYTSLPEHRFYGIPNDANNLNPFNLYATNDLADGSMKYSLANNLIHDEDLGNSIGGNITLSSVGSVYTGGTIGTVTVTIYDWNGYTTPLGTHTMEDVILGSEDEIIINIFPFISAGTSPDCFYRIWVDGVLHSNGAVPQGSLAS